MIITEDDIADIGLNATDKLIELGYIHDCTDTYDESEFEVQDAIRDAVREKLTELGIFK